MKKPQRPAGKSTGLEELVERLAENLSSEPVNPPNEAVREDIATFMMGQADALAAQFTVTGETIGLEHYSPRVLAYAREVRSKRVLWKLTASEYAAPFVMSGRISHLETVMERAHGNTESKVSMQLWLTVLPLGSNSVPCVYLRHSTGYRQMWLVRGGAWVALPLGDEELKSLLKLLLRPSPEEREFWRDVFGALISTTVDFDEERQAKFVRALDLERAPEKTALVEAISALFQTEDIFLLLMEVGRTASQDVLREAHALQLALTHLAESASSAINDAVEQTRRDHARETRALSSEVSQLKSSQKLNGKRMMKLEADLAELRSRAPKEGLVKEAIREGVQEPDPRTRAESAFRAYFPAEV